MNKLHLSPAVQRDLMSIKKYITEGLENPSAALSTVGKITKSMCVLLDHAQAGAHLSSIADVDESYRFLVSGKYMIFYRVEGNDVHVDRVLYGRRDYLRILFGDTLEDDETE